MSPKCNECPWDACRKTSPTGDKEFKSNINPSYDISMTSSDISSVNNCSASPFVKDILVYKRRKLHKASVDHPSGETANANAKESAEFQSKATSKVCFVSVKKDECCRFLVPIFYPKESVDHESQIVAGENIQQKAVTDLGTDVNSAKSLDLVSEFIPGESFFSTENVTRLDHQANLHDRCSSSDLGTGFDATRTLMDESGDCSSSGILTSETSSEVTSAKEFCVSVLKNHGLLGRALTSTSVENASTNILDDSKLSQRCKVCSIQGDTHKMLLCDICSEAYHLSCCKPRVKKLPGCEWSCQHCFRLKPKSLLENESIKSCRILKEVSDIRKKEPQPITLMLCDTKPYTSEVRIGSGFQAELPQCNSITPDKDDYFLNPPEWDAMQLSSLNVWDFDVSYKRTSIGNWIQCREVIDNGSNVGGEGTICGKWRRAPLFVKQTADWDCSCCVLWDPIHADCAVPQEVETGVVMRHLKYVKMLRPSLSNRKQGKSALR